MIETRLLRQFIAVAEELHFHKAAIRLHIAQPPLSQAINRLEGKLGFSLFTRNKREVKLTPAGTVFLQAAYQTLKALERGIEHARQVSEGIAGTLTVTAVSIAYYEPLLSTLRRFRQRFPDVQLVIREMPSSSQAKAILAAEADIAFMRKLPHSAQNIESRLLFEEAIVMALPLDHPKAQSGPIELRDFADEDFVFTPQALGSGYHNQLIALCEAAGFYPRVVQEAAQIHTLIGLVSCGFGVALVPESIAGSNMRDKVVFRPIRPVAESANPAIGLYMSWHAHNPSPLINRFIAMFDSASQRAD
ncbi:LysR family transcriptional regulator [Pseudomonas sp. MS-1(2024)]|uniref:LysR family transcriptional regulator n=1 Tax=Pseudomonas sp. MS-1(2024) TaxID=3112251 RepID=UPI002DB841AC|nr:LysR family transcriptional regulator [Pseudomonas sp. MS-1(2024)]MEC4167610.1 LysR family transcriptional regulator [Pseudomonas sp. MS-1(2024)]